MAPTETLFFTTVGALALLLGAFIGRRLYRLLRTRQQATAGKISWGGFGVLLLLGCLFIARHQYRLVHNGHQLLYVRAGMSSAHVLRLMGNPWQTDTTSFDTPWGHAAFTYRYEVSPLAEDGPTNILLGADSIVIYAGRR